MSSTTVLEDFEDNTIGDYTSVGGPIIGGVRAASAHDGALGLNIQDYDVFPGWLYRNESLVSPGYKVMAWVRPGTDGRAYVGFGATPFGTFALSVAPNTGSFILMYVSGFTSFEEFAQLPFTWTAGKWYMVTATWNSSGQVNSTILDSNGTTQLASLSGVSSTFGGVVSGGIGWRAFGGSYDVDTLSALSPTGSSSPGTPSSIPTLSEWGLLSLIGLLVTAGAVILGKRPL